MAEISDGTRQWFPCVRGWRRRVSRDAERPKQDCHCRTDSIKDAFSPKRLEKTFASEGKLRAGMDAAQVAVSRVCACSNRFFKGGEANVPSATERPDDGADSNDKINATPHLRVQVSFWTTTKNTRAEQKPTEHTRSTRGKSPKTHSRGELTSPLLGSR